jgi:hypothetical protein
MAAMPALGDDLFAQLFPLTGEVRLLNKTGAPVPFVFYQIDSPSGALTSSNAIWKSIEMNYDSPGGATPGNGLIDPNGDWLQFPSSSIRLAEGAVDADGGMLPAFRAISLGQIWDPHHVDFPDLVFDIRSDTTTIPVHIELALDGDYSSDQVVDEADYIVWRKYLDSLQAWFADGDLDGIVDIDDRLVWQQNYGLTLPLPPFGASEGGSLPVAAGVPEPSSALLLTSILASLAAMALRRRRAPNPIACR